MAPHPVDGKQIRTNDSRNTSPSSCVEMNLILLLFLLFASQTVRCESRREKEKAILARILSPERYDPRLRPPGLNNTEGPTEVRVNTFVRSIYSIDDLNMEYKLQLTFRQQWEDARLKFESQDPHVRYLTLTEPRQIWTPDLFFSNEREGHYHELMAPNLYFRIFPGGHVLYSRRLSLTLACPMNLKLYPFDHQVCSIRMASYSYTTDDLIFLWKEGDPVQIVRNLHLPKWTLQKFSTDYCNSKTNTGEYSCLKVDFLFKRQFCFYLIQIFLPCCMLVLLSFVSFWFEPSAVQARMLLGLSSLLVLAAYTSVVNASIPQISYTKAIDIWTGCCLTFVFAAFLEFATVNYMHSSRRDEDQEETAPNNDEFGMNPLINHSNDPPNGKCVMRKHLQSLKYCQRWFKGQPRRAKSLDVLSRILFPSAFLLFCLSYWISYAVMDSEP
ncbi:hypothetical protein PPYR_03368 [Photinus pyralis]|uniref:Glutamate-gated chloride channel n=2 Tax=Photinus pyralis TaxID=7054 RepID=A0A1Y1KC85_PHOPY|nr:glutamate-gated chloride channel-like [Photinus pyralis]KAB0791568.1 hypothetical protein PPYR_03368 [Photinus pyralis]